MGALRGKPYVPRKMQMSNSQLRTKDLSSSTVSLDEAQNPSLSAATIEDEIFKLQVRDSPSEPIERKKKKKPRRVDVNQTNFASMVSVSSGKQFQSKESFPSDTRLDQAALEIPSVALQLMQQAGETPRQIKQIESTSFVTPDRHSALSGLNHSAESLSTAAQVYFSSLIESNHTPWLISPTLHLHKDSEFEVNALYLELGQVKSSNSCILSFTSTAFREFNSNKTLSAETDLCLSTFFFQPDQSLFTLYCQKIGSIESSTVLKLDYQGQDSRALLEIETFFQKILSKRDVAKNPLNSVLIYTPLSQVQSMLSFTKAFSKSISPDERVSALNAVSDVSQNIQPSSSQALCISCATSVAEVLCDSCGDKLCSECDIVMHRNSKRQHHVRRSISTVSIDDSYNDLMFQFYLQLITGRVIKDYACHFSLSLVFKRDPEWIEVPAFLLLTSDEAIVIEICESEEARSARLSFELKRNLAREELQKFEDLAQTRILIRDSRLSQAKQELLDSGLDSELLGPLTVELESEKKRDAEELLSFQERAATEEQRALDFAYSTWKTASSSATSSYKQNGLFRLIDRFSIFDVRVFNFGLFLQSLRLEGLSFSFVFITRDKDLSIQVIYHHFYEKLVFRLQAISRQHLKPTQKCLKFFMRIHLLSTL